MKDGGSVVPANCDCSGEAARSAFSATGGDVGRPLSLATLAVAGRESSSLTTDCLLALCSSSASSAISINLRRRKELVEDDVDPEAVCREHAADSLVSLSSFAIAIVNVVS